MAGELLVKLIAELKAARTDEARQRAARRLREYVRAESRSGQDVAFGASMSALNNKLFELINGSDADKLAAIFAIDELIAEPMPDNETKIVRFANYLRVVPPSTTDPNTLRLAAKALGHLASSSRQTGGTMTADFVEFEAKRALEWLQVVEPRIESRKLASVYILRELIDNAPTLFYQNVSVFFAHIWAGLSDPKLQIREASARALASCLRVVAERKSRSREQWYSSLYNTARGALAGGGVAGGGGSTGGMLGSSSSSASRWSDMVHSALLTIGGLLDNSAAFASQRYAEEADASSATFLAPRFNEMCEMILKYRDSKDKLVRRTVIQLLPKLAHFHPEAFVRSYAEIALAHLLACLKDPKQADNRSVAYAAVGRIALAVGSHLASDALRPQLERIVDVVREGLAGRSKTKQYVPQALACVAMLARAVGPGLTDYCHALIDPMFSDGLSPMLTEALTVMSQSIHALKPLLQERLLHELSVILAGRPFVPPYSDPSVTLYASGDAFAAQQAEYEAVHGRPMRIREPYNAYGLLPLSMTLPSLIGAGQGGKAPSHASVNAVIAAGGLPTSGPYHQGPISAASLGFLSSSGSAGSKAGPGGVASGGSGGGSADRQAAGSAASSAMSWAKYLSSSAAGYSMDSTTISGASGVQTSAGGGSALQGWDSTGFGPVVLARHRSVPLHVVCLALHTLGTFDLAGVPLLPFVREVVLHYLDDDDPSVRLEAALTTCRLLVRPSELSGADEMDPLLVAMGMDDAQYAFDEDAGEDNAAANGMDNVDDDEVDVLGADVLGPVALLRSSMGASRSKHTSHSLAHPGRDDEQAGGGRSSTAAQQVPRSGGDRDHYDEPLGRLSALDKRRRGRHLRSKYARNLKPPQHPLLVFGTDVLSSGTLGMGEYLTPVTSAVGAAAAQAARLQGGRGNSADSALLLGALVNLTGPGPTLILVSQALQRLVMMAVTDSDPAIRFEMLRCLDSRFDPLLIEQETLRLLFLGLQDENYACREATLALLGRLTAQNPSHVLPALRRTMMTLMSELEYADAHPDVTPPVLTGTSGAGGAGQRGRDASASTDVNAAAASGSGADGKGGLSDAASAHAHMAMAMGAADLADGFVSGAGLASTAPAAARLSAYHSLAAHEVVLATSAGGGGREHAARMIGLLVRSAQRLVTPYVPILLRALLPHTWGTSQSRALLMSDSLAPLPSSMSHIASSARPEMLSTCIISAIGELSAVGSDAMLPYLHVLIPVVVDGLTQAAHALGVGSGITTNSATIEAVHGMSGSRNPRLTGGAGAGSGSGPGTMLSAAGVPSPLPMVGLAANVQPALFVAVAVRTLGLLVENTGSVIVPYLDHPHLLHLLLALLIMSPSTLTTATAEYGYSGHHKAGASDASYGFINREGGGMLSSSGWQLKREVLRTLGILGAPDPYRHRMAQIAQAQRAASAMQAAVQARLIAAIASARAQGRRLAAINLSPEVLRTGVRPGQLGAVPLLMDEDIAPNGLPHAVNAALKAGKSSSSAGVGDAHDASTNDGMLVVPSPDGNGVGVPWDVAASIPTITGVALGGGIDVDPMEAALAGLAGEPGAYVGVNIDEVGLGMVAVTSATALGLGGSGYGNLAGGLALGANFAGGDDRIGAAIQLGGGGGGLLAGYGVQGMPGLAGDMFGPGGYKMKGYGTGAGYGTAGAGGGAGSAGAGAGGAIPADGGVAAGGQGAFAALTHVPASLLLPSMVTNPADFAPTVSLTALLGMLGDENSSLHHNAALQAIMHILKSLGSAQRCLPFLPRVVPAFLYVLRASAKAIQSGAASGPMGSSITTTGAGSGSASAPGSGSEAGAGGASLASSSASEHSGHNLRDTVLDQLAILVALVKTNMRPWLPGIFILIRELWPASVPASLKLIEAIAGAFGDEAKPHIATLIPHFLSVLAHDGTRPVLSPTPAAEVMTRDSLYNTVVSASLSPNGASLSGYTGVYVTADGSVGVAAPGTHPNAHPSPARNLTRHVMHTIAVLACGGRRALYGGHRHLLDDHYQLLIPALARLVDAGVSAYNTGTAITSGGIVGAADDVGDAAGAKLQQPQMNPWVTCVGVPSNSSSLAGYGPVAPAVRRQALDTLAAIAAGGVDLTVYAARLVQPLARVLADPPSSSSADIKRAALDCLCLLLLQLKEDYVIWIPLVRKSCAAAAGTIDGIAADASSNMKVAEGGGRSGPGGKSKAEAEEAAAAAASAAARDGAGHASGGLSGAGAGAAPSVRHETYERLVALLLGCGSGYGYTAEDEFSLYGYGPPPPLPTNPVELASLLHDPGTCGKDGSGPRLAAALSLSNTTSGGAAVGGGTSASGGKGGAAAGKDAGAGGGGGPVGEVVGEAGLLGAVSSDNDTFGPPTSLADGDFGSGDGGSEAGAGIDKLPVNQEALKRSWETTARSTKEDWQEWMRRFSVELLRESPAPALRACCALAQVHTPLASELFNCAFVAMWSELFDEYQESLVQALETAFVSPYVPIPILQALLNLAEFMEHDEKALPTDVKRLGALAEKVGAAAKALHYNEIEFNENPGDPSVIEALISINNQLDQPEAAVGILKCAQRGATRSGAYGYRASHVPMPGQADSNGFIAANGGNAMGNQAYNALNGDGDGGGGGLILGPDGLPLAGTTGALNASRSGRRGMGGSVGGMQSPDTSSESSVTGGGGNGGTGIVEVQESWYEKLGRWEDALDAYERRQAEQPASLAIVLGRMRCLKNLGEWQKLDELARSAWPRLEGNVEGRGMVAPFAARAAWALGRWRDMDVYLPYISHDGNIEGSFLRAILATHRLQFDEAARHVDRARKGVASELASMSSDTYSRAYRLFVTAQILSEIEEINTYLRLAAGGNTAGAATYVSHLRNTWTARMRGIARNVDVWNRVLSVRSLITLASESMGEWLQFSSLCRRTGRMGMAMKVLMGLGESSLPSMQRVPASDTAANYLSGQPVASDDRGRYIPGLIRPDMDQRQQQQQQPVRFQFHVFGQPQAMIQGAGAGATAAASNPMLAPDHPYQPFELQSSSDRSERDEAGARVGPRSGAHPRVTYAYLKHLWYSGYRTEAVESIKALTALLEDNSAQRRQAVAESQAKAAATSSQVASSDDPSLQPSVYGRHTMDPTDENALRVQCHLRLGQWTEGLMEPVINNYTGTGALATAGSVGGTPHATAAVGSAAAIEPSPCASDGSATPGVNTSRDMLTSTVVGAGTAAGSSRHRMPSAAYSELVAPILSAFRTATHDCGERGYSHYRAWHAWAMANFTSAQYYAENLRVDKEKEKHDRERERLERVSSSIIVPGGAGAAGAGGAKSGAGAPSPSAAVPAGRQGSRRHLSGGPSSGTIGEDKKTSTGAGETDTAVAPASTSAAPPPVPFPTKVAVEAHAAAAVKAFFRSIALGRTRLKAYILQDLLRLLTVWFNHGEAPSVHKAIAAGLDTGAISVDVWLQVIPQLIARISIPGRRGQLLKQLLSRIGVAHPQALIYPLTVATNSADIKRREAAHVVMTEVRKRYPLLVEQAGVVSTELIRVAILWPEQWHSALEDASRVFFGEGNPQAMLELLLPLHDQMNNPGPQTQREVAFVQEFGRQLSQAHVWLKLYKQHLDAGVPKEKCAGDAAAAWDIYYQIFRKINKILPTITSLELPFVSPRLLSAYDLELSVPGTYSAGAPVVRIMTFCPTVDIIASKQRPRKTTMQGSDGRQYTFLLKGHEDLRQDERVMQLFGLVNTLLSNDYATSRRDLSIRRYAVTPLSHTAGVVGWVPATDTLHALIREYRDARKILLNIEHRLMCQMASMYDGLTPLQKLEVFRYALDNTTGQDLHKVLWLKSASSEVWLDRRTAYTRSLAVMSIVGYVLGLGDRHPSNLLLDRVSGKILHIDFGDCFETSMSREKFPERVPFRLTRMLIVAMEAAGIEGSYRSTCENVVRVMRQHRDSVMAMLEAFVHDPLINWRLLGNAPAAQPNAAAVAAGGQAQPSNAGAAVVAKSTNTAADAAASAVAPGTSVASRSRTNAGAPTAGVSSLAGNDSKVARSFADTAMKFQAEIDASNLASAVAATGINPSMQQGGGAAGQTADHATNAAIARSLATSVRGARGDREKVLLQATGPDGMDAPTEAVNERAVAVLRRIQAKLTGRDFSDDDPIGQLMSQGVGFGFGGGSGGWDAGGVNLRAGPDGTLDVTAQVQRLVLAATSHENLCQCYIGWCPFW